MSTEQDRQDRFVRIVGGIAKADRLMAIWNNSSYPGISPFVFPGPPSKEVMFKRNARREGFSDGAIQAFLKLQ